MISSPVDPILPGRIREQSAAAELTTSVCTGSFLLAKAGLLVGKSTTTHWGSIDRMREDFPGLDVRENVKFGGGYFAAWTHTNFPNSACVLAIEFKKFFMDEWTGRADDQQLDTIRRALAATKPGVLEELGKL